MKTILFVDDQEVLARLSCDILMMHGYSAEYAFNGLEALGKFEQKAFDILVTDFQMEGINGLELARLVRLKVPEIPVIIVSGYPPSEGSGEVNAWLQKEELFPALLDLIQQYTSEPKTDELQSV